MSLSRFFLPHLPQHGRVALPAEEAAHAFRVLRVQRDDAVVLFDGRGYEAHGIVTESKRSCVECEIRSYAFAPRDLPGVLVMAVGLPKGDRQRSVIEKAVELGVHALVPIRTQRSVAEPTDSAIDRMERYVVEASKQCGRNRLMRIAVPQTWDELVDIDCGRIQELAPNGSEVKTCQRWLAHPFDRTNPSVTVALSPSNSVSSTRPTSLSADQATWFNQPVLIAVGPEGGFTQDEVAKAMRSGWRMLRMGDRILRVETAVAALAAFAGNHLAPPEFLS